MSRICIDRDKTIGRLKMVLGDAQREKANSSAGDYEKAGIVAGIEKSIDVVEHVFRVHHDIGVCAWTRSKDGDGMVHYDASCGSAESFFETVRGMEFRFCPFCGAKIVEEGN